MLIVVLVLVSLVVTAVLLGQKIFQSNLDEIADLPIEDISLPSIPDGAYKGHYAAFPIEVDVLVTVGNQHIREVKIVKHVNGQGAPAEAIVNSVVAEQSLDVDLVAGATYSSKVILKAVEMALKQAE